MSAGASVSATSLVTQCGQHKASPGRRPLRVEQARWRQGSRGVVLVRAVQRARNGAISAASRRRRRRRAAFGQVQGHAGSKRIEGIKKHAHRQRVLARPARALILACQGRCNGQAARRPARSGSAAAPIAPCTAPRLRAAPAAGHQLAPRPTGDATYPAAPPAPAAGDGSTRPPPDRTPPGRKTPARPARTRSGNRARAASCAISMRGSKASSVDTNAASSFASPPATRCSTAPSPENPAPFPGSDPA